MVDEPIERAIEWLSIHSFDESILTPLLEKSERFAKLMDCFHQKKRNIRIFFVDNSTLNHEAPFNSLGQGVLASLVMLDEEIRVIVIRNIPLSIADETTIAHEMAHLLLELDGFPLVELTRPEAIENNQGFLQSINNLLHDPLVISILGSFGYDLKMEYLLECKEGTRLSRYANEPSGRFEVLINAFSYVQNYLENDIIFGRVDNPCKEYNIIFGKKFKISKVMGRQILQLIRENGIKTPRGLLKIYNAIIADYGLSDIVKINSNINGE